MGRVTDHHTFLLQELLSHIEFLDDQIAVFEAHTRPLASSADEKVGSALLSEDVTAQYSCCYDQHTATHVLFEIKK